MYLYLIILIALTFCPSLNHVILQLKKKYTAVPVYNRT